MSNLTVSGMTLRDWFAGQALAGLCAQHDSEGEWSWYRISAAEKAYVIAEAMIEAREADEQRRKEEAE